MNTETLATMILSMTVQSILMFDPTSTGSGKSLTSIISGGVVSCGYADGMLMRMPRNKESILMLTSFLFKDE